MVRNTPVDDRGALDARKRSRRARWRCSARSTATACGWSACPASASNCAAARTSRRPATSDRSSIVAESGVAAGVRRIEALTGTGAVALSAGAARGAARGSSTRCTSHREQAVEAIERLQSDAKKLAREVSQLKTKLAMGGGGATAGRRHGRRRRRQAGAPEGRRPRQGCAARARRFAESADPERRRRHRVGERRQGADGRRGDARSDIARQGGRDREGARADRRRRRRRAAGLRGSRRQAPGEDRRDARRCPGRDPVVCWAESRAWTTGSDPVCEILSKSAESANVHAAAPNIASDSSSPAFDRPIRRSEWCFLPRPGSRLAIVSDRPR